MYKSHSLNGEDIYEGFSPEGAFVRHAFPINSNSPKKRLPKILGGWSAVVLMFTAFMVPQLTNWGPWWFIFGMAVTSLIILLSYFPYLLRFASLVSDYGDEYAERVEENNYESLPKVLQVLDQILRHVGLLLGIPSFIGIFALVGFSLVKMPNLLPAATDLAIHPSLQWVMLVTLVIFLIAIAVLTWHYLSKEKKDIQQGEQLVDNLTHDDKDVELELSQKERHGNELAQRDPKKSTRTANSSSRLSEQTGLLGSSSSTYGTNAGDGNSVVGDDFSGSVVSYIPSSGQGQSSKGVVLKHDQLDLDDLDLALEKNAQQQPQPGSYVPSGAGAF